MSTHHTNAKERGAAHLVLVLAFVVGLVGVLGFLGYNAWQKQSANAGADGTVGRATVPSLRILPSHFDLNYTDPNILKVVNDNGTQALRIAAPSGGYAYAAHAQYEYYASEEDRLNGVTTTNEKIKTFHYAAAGKDVRICAALRVKKPIKVPENLSTTHVLMGLDFTVKNNDWWAVGVKPTTQYKNFCRTVKFVDKAQMDEIYIQEKHTADATISNLGNYPKQPLFVKSISMRVVE